MTQKQKVVEHCANSFVQKEFIASLVEMQTYKIPLAGRSNTSASLPPAVAEVRLFVS